MSDEETAPELTADDFKITPDFSPEDYDKDWSQQLCYVEDHDEREQIFNKFYKYVWTLLFGAEANEETQAKAIALLVIERPDAAFHNPFAYNDWIRTVREEIIKKQMFDFWQKEIVPKKLGLLWARDSDYFDDMEDPEPAKFYKLRDTDPDVVWDV